MIKNQRKKRLLNLQKKRLQTQRIAQSKQRKKAAQKNLQAENQVKKRLSRENTQNSESTNSVAKNTEGSESTKNVKANKNTKNSQEKARKTINQNKPKTEKKAEKSEKQERKESKVKNNKKAKHTEDKPEKNKPEQKPKKDKKQETKTVAMATKAKPKDELPELPKKGNLVFVFDDAGHNLDQLEYFLKLPFPCTIAVIPRLRYSKEAANRIRKAGKEIILHQPMQAMNLKINPGEGAIKPGMSEQEIADTLIANINEIAPIVGMNNHEGSLMTSDETAMRVVLNVCKKKNIFFLDSRTSSKTVCPKIARELNFPIWQRAVFLDNIKTEAAMKKQIIRGLEIAEKTGTAIMIGHIVTVDLAKLLEKMYAELQNEGYSFTTITRLKKEAK